MAWHPATGYTLRRAAVEDAREAPAILALYRHPAFIDFLTAVDQLDAVEDPGFDVVVHLWSMDRREHLLLRTRVPADAPTLDTATGVFAGASWHERETFEMFGVDFAGHPHLVPLLLPDGFEGHPLRKSFVLAARAAKAWPGAKEPGESDEGAAPSEETEIRVLIDADKLYFGVRCRDRTP
jgi:NADH:ubiquinone oxidoreductase subunit C